MFEVSNHHNLVSVEKQQQKSSIYFLHNHYKFSLCFHCNDDDAAFSECHPSCLTSLLLPNAENASHLNGRKSLNLSSRYFHDSQ